MQKLGLLLICYFLIISIQAQIDFGKQIKIDDIQYFCTYGLTYKIDSTNLEKTHSIETLLLVGNQTSQFLTKGMYLQDSVCHNFEGEDGQALIGQVFALPKARFLYKIYKNYPKGKLTYAKQIIDGYLYEESMNLFDWKIENQTDTIAEYVCQKATTSFAGRDYEAWFTTEIPINDGPYKFQGLPGFIVKVQDTKQHYIFTFKHLEKK